MRYKITLFYSDFIEKVVILMQFETFLLQICRAGH